MPDQFEYISRARLEYKDGYRHAYLGEVPELWQRSEATGVRIWHPIHGDGDYEGGDRCRGLSCWLSSSRAP